jgi:hypothetical protein
VGQKVLYNEYSEVHSIPSEMSARVGMGIMKMALKNNIDLSDKVKKKFERAAKTAKKG